MVQTFTLTKHDIIIKVIKIKIKDKALKQKKSISLITTNKVINNIRINLHVVVAKITLL